MTDIPGPCPCCGGVTIAPSTHRAVLLAVCDVLATKALERIGSRLLRVGRERYALGRDRPRHTIHTIWPESDDRVSTALRGAWDVVPALLLEHGCGDVTPRQVEAMLDEYVHDLVVSGLPHDPAELRYRFETRLGLTLYDHAHG